LSVHYFLVATLKLASNSASVISVGFSLSFALILSSSEIDSAVPISPVNSVSVLDATIYFDADLTDY
jgi:hypothetical protein